MNGTEDRALNWLGLCVTVFRPQLLVTKQRSLRSETRRRVTKRTGSARDVPVSRDVAILAGHFLASQLSSRAEAASRRCVRAHQPASCAMDSSVFVRMAGEFRVRLPRGGWAAFDARSYCQSTLLNHPLRRPANTSRVCLDCHIADHGSCAASDPSDVIWVVVRQRAWRRAGHLYFARPMIGLPFKRNVWNPEDSGSLRRESYEAFYCSVNRVRGAERNRSVPHCCWCCCFRFPSSRSAMREDYQFQRSVLRPCRRM